MKSAFDYLAIAPAKNTPSGLGARIRPWRCEVALGLIKRRATQNPRRLYREPPRQSPPLARKKLHLATRSKPYALSPSVVDLMCCDYAKQSGTPSNKLGSGASSSPEYLLARINFALRNTCASFWSNFNWAPPLTKSARRHQDEK